MISLLRLVSPFSLYVHLEHHTSRISQRTIFLAVLLEIPLFMVLLYGSCILYVDQDFDISLTVFCRSCYLVRLVVSIAWLPV